MKLTKNKKINKLIIMLICFISSTAISIAVPLLITATMIAFIDNGIYGIPIALIDVSLAIFLIYRTRSDIRKLYDSYMRLASFSDYIMIPPNSFDMVICVLSVFATTLLLFLNHNIYHYQYKFITVSSIYLIIISCYRIYRAVILSAITKFPKDIDMKYNIKIVDDEVEDKDGINKE